MKRKTIGVIGYGFVGQAVARGLCDCVDVIVYDNDPEKGWKWFMSGEETKDFLQPEKGIEFSYLVRKASIIFVCVPTPMQPDGSCDTSIVEGIVESLNKESMGLASARPAEQRPTVVIKSTVPPGTTARLQVSNCMVDLVFNPEFLTEVNSERDFAEQDRVILGVAEVSKSSMAAAEKVADLYREFGIVRNIENQKKNPNASWGSPRIDVCTSTEAEMVKYLTNCFLAVKVSLANEFAQVCEKVEANWETVWVMASLDERLGVTHWAVPGPDGHKGFGGSCFPKDICGMIQFMGEHEVLPDTLVGAWETNLAVRPERDWEDLKGRAVV